MKAISTHYVGPGNVRGSRMIARDADHNKVIVPYDYALNLDENHAKAAETLCRKLKWTGTLVGGGTKEGMAWVFTSNGSPMIHIREYQPKTGQACSCRPGVERDNCARCEGTGMCIDFAAIRAR